MKKIIALVCMCLSIGCNYAQKPITGTWNGTLAVGGNSLRMVFHFAKQSDGTYIGSMDSPDQGANGIHCDSVTMKGDSIIALIKIVNGGYRGLMINDSTINGNWSQGGMFIPVVLKRNKADKQVLTETNKDSNCVETPIVLETKTGKIYGTLCVPKGFKKGPVAIIIAGSGPTDRDGNSSMGLKTDAYKILAHKLAADNIATVRYDKRGIAESHAAMISEALLTFDNFIDDAGDWVKKLKSDNRFSRIVVIGHSEGSLVGMVAAKRAGADKYVSVAGAGESIDKTLKRQLQDMPEDSRDTAYKMLDSLKAGKLITHVDSKFYSLFRPSVQPYMISWIKYDPTVEIAKLSIPVLIIQGTNDVQVTVDDAKNLSAADKNAKLVLLENMNHIFRVIQGDRQTNLATYNMPTLPIDPKLVTAIEDFINKN